MEVWRLPFVRTWCSHTAQRNTQASSEAWIVFAVTRQRKPASDEQRGQQEEAERDRAGWHGSQ